jgi:Cryptococcal mannosyltransferase 1
MSTEVEVISVSSRLRKYEPRGAKQVCNESPTCQKSTVNYFGPFDPGVAASNTTNVFRSVSDQHFDRILCLSDVYFNPLDASQLLFSTNEGDYWAACVLDFIEGLLYYDTFATRDHDGHRMGLVISLFRSNWQRNISEQRSPPNRCIPSPLLLG